MMKKFLNCLFLTIACHTAYAEETEEVPPLELWTTAPLLAPAGDILTIGEINYEPYLYFTRFKDVYNTHWHTESSPLFTTLSFQPLFRFGILPVTEFDITPNVSYNHSLGEGSWTFADMLINFDVGLLELKREITTTTLKLRLSANIPVGKYQKLNPAKNGTAIGGTGSWAPGLGLIFYNTTHFYAHHFLATTFFTTYQFGTPVKVKGFNTYGGDETTRGTVYGGNLFQTILSFEYSLSQNWVLSLDNQYNHIDRTRFSGSSEDSPTGGPSSESFSMAPAIEYCWSENFGIIGGAWLTVAGRNTDQFISWVIAINIYQD